MYKNVLVAWVCPKNGSPQLIVQLESLKSAVLQQSLLGLILFSTSISDTESASSASSQMPPNWVVQQEAMPSRGILTGWRRWFSPSTPLFWDPTWNTASSSRIPSTRKTWSCWIAPKDGTKIIRGLKHFYHEIKLRVGVVHLVEECALGRPYCGLSILKQGLWEGEMCFSSACIIKQSNGFKLKTVDLD